MKPYYKPNPEDPIYSKLLSNREKEQVLSSMEIRARITRELNQAKKLEQKQYERNMSSFVSKLQDKWK